MGRKPWPGFTLTLKYPALHLSNACSSYAQAVKKWKSSTGLDSTKAQQLKPRGDCRDFEGPKATALGHHHPTGTAGQLFYCFSISGLLKTVEGIKDSEDNCFSLLPLLAAVRQSPDFPEAVAEEQSQARLGWAELRSSGMRTLNRESSSLSFLWLHLLCWFCSGQCSPEMIIPRCPWAQQKGSSPTSAAAGNQSPALLGASAIRKKQKMFNKTGSTRKELLKSIMRGSS